MPKSPRINCPRWLVAVEQFQAALSLLTKLTAVSSSSRLIGSVQLYVIRRCYSVVERAVCNGEGQIDYRRLDQLYCSCREGSVRSFNKWAGSQTFQRTNFVLCSFEEKRRDSFLSLHWRSHGGARGEYGDRGLPVSGWNQSCNLRQTAETIFGRRRRDRQHNRREYVNSETNFYCSLENFRIIFARKCSSDLSYFLPSSIFRKPGYATAVLLKNLSQSHISRTVLL